MSNVTPMFGRKKDLHNMKAALEVAYTFLERYQNEMDHLLEVTDQLQETYDWHMKVYVKRVGLDNVEIGLLEYVGDLGSTI